MRRFRIQNSEAKTMKDRIYQLMKQHNMSQKEFAGELCIAEGTLSSLFSGRTKASSNIVFSIHERFPEVSIPWLMFGEGEMLNSPATTETSTPSPTPQPGTFVPDMFQSVATQNIPTPATQDAGKVAEKPQRKIIEIKVFFDDGTFQTFGV